MNDLWHCKHLQLHNILNLCIKSQLKAASVSDSRQVHWHPLLIKWCLNLKLISSASYHAVHSSGFLRLPSECTLRNYTNYFTNQPGFQPDLNEQLAKEADVKSLAKNKKYVALLEDEMKIKEDLVYNKTTGKIIGFTSLGNISDIFVGNESKMPRQLCTTSTSCKVYFGVNGEGYLCKA